MITNSSSKDIKSEQIVTVITLVYNGIPFLKESVESILNQNYYNFKYLIIDDCSTDDSYIYLKSINDPRVTLIRNETNLGVSKSFNKGLNMIETLYIIRQDQDDVSLPNRINEQIHFLQNNPELSVICSFENVIDKNNRIIRKARSKIINYGQTLASIMLGLCPVWHPSLAFKTSALKSIGGFDERYNIAEDFDVTSRLILNRLNVDICPEFHLNVREHINQQSQMYNVNQQRFCLKMQLKNISQFQESNNSELLHLYFSRNLSLKYLLKNDILKKLENDFDIFLIKIQKQLILNRSEYKTFLTTIYDRVGYGFKYKKFYKNLPCLIRYFVFLLLSPQYIFSRLKKVTKLKLIK